MTRMFALLAALAIAAPASAASYTAKPATPASEARIVARDIVWNCGADSCRGSTDESRPQVLCQSLAKKAGKLESFDVEMQCRRSPGFPAGPRASEITGLARADSEPSLRSARATSHLQRA